MKYSHFWGENTEVQHVENALLHVNVCNKTVGDSLQQDIRKKKLRNELNGSQDERNSSHERHSFMFILYTFAIYQIYRSKQINRLGQVNTGPLHVMCDRNLLQNLISYFMLRLLSSLL